MGEKKVSISDVVELRHYAEERLKKEKNNAPASEDTEDPRRLLHELQVHQIELDIQNAELRQAKEEIEELLERQTDLYDFAPVGYFSLDRTGSILSVNLTGAKLLGIERSRLQGRPFTHYVTEATRPMFTTFIAKNFAAQSKLACDATLLKADGSSVAVQIEALTDSSGHECRLVISDISELQRAKQALQTSQQRKMEALGLMAGGMAHNFNNNLSVILGNLELAQLKCTCSDEIRDFMANAKVALLRSRDLIKQIMIYSRSNDSELDAIPAVDVLEETNRLLGPMVPTSVHFKKEISPRVGRSRIKGDFTRIQEALINLCTNSIQAMDEKGTLTMKLDRVQLTSHDLISYPGAGAGAYLCFTVTDTGEGFSEAVAEKIFDPFFTTKAPDKGTGMGLATVRGIVNTHHGFIKVNSTIGKGTSIQLYFPEGQGDEAVATEERNDHVARGAGKIIIVDDNEMVLEVNRRLLQELGYQVTACLHPYRALEMIERDSQSFDLVMTDQTMPGLTGKELAGKIKKIAPDLPIILCTGFSSQVDPNEAEQLGIKALCMKPLQRDEIAKVVKDSIG